MDSETKQNLLKDIKRYGSLLKEGREFSAARVLGKIDRNLLTDRERFFRWMEEP